MLGISGQPFENPYGFYVNEWIQTDKVDERGVYVSQFSDKSIAHLMKFSRMVKYNHSFTNIIGIAAQVSLLSGIVFGKFNIYELGYRAVKELQL